VHLTKILVNAVIVIAGAMLVILVCWDVFTGILVPGRSKRGIRFIPRYFHSTWALWSAIGSRIRTEDRRERFFGFYGPLAMIVLIGLWAIGLILGFGLIQAGLTPGPWPTVLGESMYSAGSRMFTVAAGDWARGAAVTKMLVVVGAGMGLGFFTIVITYLPVLYQGFSRREAHVILLDQRAGKPVTAASVIQNHARRGAMTQLDSLLAEWEKWGAELMESHISYPMLSYYRSPQTDQSWLVAIAVIMDTCALRLAGAGGIDEFQAEATFSICLRALRGIGEILRLEPHGPRDPRLTEEQWGALSDKLREWELPDGGRDLWPRLSRMRDGYEPLLAAFADYLVMELPEWIPASMIQSPLEAARS
jgi:hypothetical protein